LLKKKLKSKIKKLFKDLKIFRNDNVIIHSNTAGIFQFLNKSKNKSLRLFIETLINYIGKNGTILIPTYNYDFTRGKTFQTSKSLSQVGELGNILMKIKSNNRTNEPVFSHLVIGKLKKKIFNCDTEEAFGDKSVFSYMLKKNFKIFCFCCSPSTMTFIHFIEKKAAVDYRFNKYFKGFIKIDNKKKPLRYKYCVGKKNIDCSPKEKQIYNLLGKNLIIKNFGRFNCSQIDSKLLFKIIKNKLSRNKHVLINDKNKF